MSMAGGIFLWQEATPATFPLAYYNQLVLIEGERDPVRVDHNRRLLFSRSQAVAVQTVRLHFWKPAVVRIDPEEDAYRVNHTQRLMFSGRSFATGVPTYFYVPSQPLIEPEDGTRVDQTRLHRYRTTFQTVGQSYRLWPKPISRLELEDNEIRTKPYLIHLFRSNSTIVGTSSTTNANDFTSSAQGTTTILGTLATTNANDTSSASGTTTVVGTSSTTNANDTSAASGSVGNSVTGTSSTTNANDTSAAQGSPVIVGTSTTTNANDTSAAQGTTTIVGTLARTNNNDTVAASGSSGTPPVGGNPKLPLTGAGFT